MLNNIAGVLAPTGSLSNPAYESIQTVDVGSGGQSSITFSSIPSTFKHLQIRAIAKNSVSADLFMRFNSDSGSNYIRHFLSGSGSGTPSAAAQTSQTGMAVLSPTSSYFDAAVIDILDYTNTNKYTTTRNLHGRDENGGGQINLESYLWLNTAAISTISITGNTILQYSSFALYGIKG